MWVLIAMFFCLGLSDVSALDFHREKVGIKWILEALTILKYPYIMCLYQRSVNDAVSIRRADEREALRTWLTGSSEF